MNCHADLAYRSSTSPEHLSGARPVEPPVDVYENQSELLIVADVPGATKESIAVSVDRGQLTIEAKRTEENSGTPTAWEFRVRDYRRVFSVPQSIDASKIEANLAGGVLRVHLPKAETHKPRRITVQAS